MILLANTSSLLNIITSSTANIDVHASYMDYNGSSFTPGVKNTAIVTATTTAIVNSPGFSVYRTVKTITIRNKHATTVNTITVIHTDGTTQVELLKITLASDEVLHYHESAGFWVTDAFGRTKLNDSTNGSGAAVNNMNLVVLSSDVVNNNATANTIADITGLSFDVTAGEGYWFRFNIIYTAAATATGSRFSINGPGSPTWLGYRSSVGLGTAGTGGTDVFTDLNAAVYDSQSGANATSPTATAGQLNTALITGFIQPSANGTVVGRFASEISSSAITAKKGSFIEWYRVY